MPHPVRVYPARRAFAVGHPGDLPARRGRISWLGHCCGCFSWLGTVAVALMWCPEARRIRASTLIEYVVQRSGPSHGVGGEVFPCTVSVLLSARAGDSS
jgi:hypothetical protein